jgi:hypothetical protein
MFDKLIGNWCRRMHLDSWKSLLNLLAGWHPSLRKQEDAALVHGGLTVSCGQCGGVGGGGLASQLA